jgi:hypothetical protein
LVVAARSTRSVVVTDDDDAMLLPAVQPSIQLKNTFNIHTTVTEDVMRRVTPTDGMGN